MHQMLGIFYSTIEIWSKLSQKTVFHLHPLTLFELNPNFYTNSKFS